MSPASRPVRSSSRSHQHVEPPHARHQRGLRPVQTTIETINFTRGVPATESFPIAELSAAADAALREHGPAMLQYGPSPGFLPLREWLARSQQVGIESVL